MILESSQYRVNKEGGSVMPQIQLPFFPDGVTEVNTHLAFIREGDTVTYVYGHLPIFSHHVDDIQTFRMITSQIYINGNAKQSELSRAFGITAISLKRSIKVYRKKGVAGFYKERQRRGAAVLTGPVLEKAQRLLDEGREILEVADELGLKKDTVRKAVGAGRLHKALKKTKP